MNAKGLRAELEAELQRLLTIWFPRCLDREHGGFLCDFDHRWKPAGPQRKMLEYQARQTLAAARAAERADGAVLREAAAHGFRYLKDTLWDAWHGGWYHLLDRAGKPLERGSKHGHGTSYAISACVACHRLTGDPESLELAKQAFLWLEAHAHDAEHGGYFVLYEEDGTPILSPDRAAVPGVLRDAIGTPIGYKDANTTSDLLHALGDLYRAWPDELVRRRLEEMLAIVLDRFVVPPGLMHMYLHPNWTPVPDFARYGQALRCVNMMLPSAEALGGEAEQRARRVARTMVDSALRAGWDSKRGGFHLAGSGFGPTYIEDTVVYVRDKCWWPQAEGMRALLRIARFDPSASNEYHARFEQLWEYVKRYVIDEKHGGWRHEGLDTNPEAGKRPKATMWKDSSHEVEALLDSLVLLDGA